MSITASIPVAETAQALAKAKTGITGLDEITRGGLPAGRPTLVCGGPGCGKTLFAMQFLVAGATRFDEPGVFMSFEERSEIEESGEYDLEGLFLRLDFAIQSVNAKRVVLDTIESLFSGFQNEA